MNIDLLLVEEIERLSNIVTGEQCLRSIVAEDVSEYQRGRIAGQIEIIDVINRFIKEKGEDKKDELDSEFEEFIRVESDFD